MDCLFIEFGVRFIKDLYLLYYNVLCFMQKNTIENNIRDPFHN